METEKAFTRIKKTREYRAYDDNKQYIDALEKSFSKAISRKAFLDQDYVQEINLKIKSILANIRKNLIEEDDPIKRIELKADRDAYQKVLGWFSSDIDSELQSINQKVNEVLEET